MQSRDWMADALCRNHPAELWFPERGGRADAAAARKICLTCPVIRECARHAIETEQAHGIVAGMRAGTLEGRAKLRTIAGLGVAA